MYIQDFDHGKVVAKEIGDLKKKSVTSEGGVIFEVTNLKSNPAIWPHDKMYGVFHYGFGE